MRRLERLGSLAAAMLLGVLVPVPLALGAPSVDALEALNEQKRYEEARAGAMQAIAAVPIDTADEHPVVERLLRVLVVAFYQGGGSLDEEDDRLLDSAVRRAEDALGAGDARLARILNHRANLLTYEGRLTEARDLAERALSIQEKTLGTLHPETGEPLALLRVLMIKSGEDAKAFLYSRRLVTLWEGQAGPPSDYLAGAYLDLAAMYRLTGNTARAREYAENSLRLFEQVLGPDHYITAHTLTELAGIHRDMGDFARARALSERATRIWERTLGPEDGTFAGGLMGLAQSMAGLAEYDAARATAERGVRIAEKIDGPEAWRTAWFLTKLADVLMRAGDAVAARQALEKTMAIGERFYGPSNPVHIPTLQQLAQIDLTQGNVTKAADHALRAAAISREGFLNVSRVLSESEALGFERLRVLTTDVLLSVLARSAGPRGSGTLVDASWDQMLRSRALVLDEMAFGRL